MAAPVSDLTGEKEHKAPMRYRFILLTAISLALSEGQASSLAAQDNAHVPAGHARDED